MFQANEMVNEIHKTLNIEDDTVSDSNSFFESKIKNNSHKIRIRVILSMQSINSN